MYAKLFYLSMGISNHCCVYDGYVLGSLGYGGGGDNAR